MYLIHVRLRAPDGASLPSDTAALVSGAAGPVDGLEHVSVHADAEGGPVLGLFMTASGLAEAEKAATTLAGRALCASPALSGFSVLTIGAVLTPGPWWDAG